MDVDQPQSGLDTRNQNKTVRGASITSSGGEFELPDYWDEGVVLDDRDEWPVCVSLNLVNPVSTLECFVWSTIILEAIEIRSYMLFGRGLGGRNSNSVTSGADILFPW